MKVVQLLPALEQGGVESVVCDLNRALVGAGHVSLVISRGGKLVERIERDGGRHFVQDVRSKNPLTFLGRGWRLRKLLRRLQPDLVCVHSRVPAWLFVFANRALKLKWITYAHGANSISRYSAVMTKGDLVVSPSRFLADFLLKHYADVKPSNHPRVRATLSERLLVVHPAVDAARFDPQRVDLAFRDAKRREWGLDGQRVIMSVGRITRLKGFDALIRDFAARNEPATKLVIVGGADDRHRDYLEELRQLAQALAPGRVVFAGAQEKVPECLSLADVVVSANTVKPESFGLSVVEAYAMNRPVEARRFGGVEEIMSEVERYRVAHPGSTLRDAAISLFGFDRFQRETLAVYAREMI